MNVSSLSSAARTALSGIERVTDQIDEIAYNVAAGVSSEEGDQITGTLSELSRLADLKQQARADARVFSTVEELFAELESMPRR